MRTLFKLYQFWLSVGLFLLALFLGWGLPMMIPSSPHNGILITIIGICISAPFLIWALVLYERQRKIEKHQKAIVKTEAIELKIGAKVNHIFPHDYYAQAEGRTEFMKGRQIIVDVTLSPIKPMKIDIIEIELWGKSYPAKKIPATIIKDSQSYPIPFDIPEEIAIDTNDAQIKVLSGKDNYSSNLFEIKFTESAK